MSENHTVSSNLVGRLRNTKLSKSHGLMPIYEALVNAVHSTDEALEHGVFEKDENPSIKLSITREIKAPDLFEESKGGREKMPAVKHFSIEDNGVGFNDDNWISFSTLDSQHKLSKGCRGVGRLLWLKAFNDARIESTFINANVKSLRVITFSENKGFFLEVDEAQEWEKRSTRVELNGFDEKYSKHIPKTAHSIAEHILDHCLWYFLRDGGAPDITLHDGEEFINLDELYNEKIGKDTKTTFIEIKGVKFELIHLKYRTSGHEHRIAYCAENRLVSEDKISGKINGLYGSLTDESGHFTYVCYVRSEFLNEAVRPERDDFVISTDDDGLLQDIEITKNDLKKEIYKEVEEYLADYLEENKRLASERVNNFVSTKAPKYRPLVKRLGEGFADNVNPEIKDKDLDILFHKRKYDLEKKTLQKGHDLESSTPKNMDDETYRKLLTDYLEEVSELKKSDLAEYVTHRKLIIDLLAQALTKKDDGKYQREDFIHNFIMPIRSDSNDRMDASNLWLLDDSLAFHEYLASDKALTSMPITGSSEIQRPDLLALNIYDNPIAVSESGGQPCGSLVVVEIKRPMRNDMKAGEVEKDPIEQALSYLDKIREGGVTMSNGRPILNPKQLPGFCYILADLTSNMEKCCRRYSLKQTSDGDGYFGYHEGYQSYIEVVSFDRMLSLAKKRNRAFFDKLGLSST